MLILGGGLAGIACAVGLRGAGVRIKLIEQAAALGGRARSWVDSHTGDSVDLGPHILLTEYRNMLSLLDTLGTRNRVVWQRDKLITLLERAGPTAVHLHRLPPPLHLAPGMLRARDVSLGEKLSNARAVWFAMHLEAADAYRLDQLPASELLQQLGVAPRFIEWFWKTASLSLMNVPLERCSSGALMRFFSQFIGHNDYQFGFAGCGLDALFLPAAERLIEGDGHEISRNTTAVRILHEGSSFAGARLTNGAQVRARFCVCALPPAELARVLPPEWLAHADLRDLERFEPSPYISVYLWFDRKLTQERFWARVWSEGTLNYDFYDLSNIRPGWSRRPSVIASNIIYCHRAAGLDDDEIVARTVQELAEFAPDARRARVLHSRVHRIEMAIPCPCTGTETRRPSTLTAFDGLLLAGDWTRTDLPASMESAVRSGFLAAEHILASLGRPRKLALLPRPTEGFAGLVRRLTHRAPRHAERH